MEVVPLHQRRRRSLFDCSLRLVTRTETAEYDTSQLPAGSFCQVETFTVNDQSYIHLTTTEYVNPCISTEVSDRYVCIITATVRC